MKWAKKTSLGDLNLLEAIDNLEKGLSVAELSGILFKIRVKRASKGKNSGFRTIVVYRKKEKVIFLKQITDSTKKQIFFDLEVTE